MINKPIEIKTPVGRLVQGDLWVPQTTDADGNPLVCKSGPNIGQPRVDYFFAIAILKTDPGYAELWAKIHAVGKVAFPSLFDAAGNADIAWKVIDGDSQIPNKKGKKPCDKEGFPGHMILNFSSGFAPKVCDRDPEIRLIDPTSVKRGYYIRVLGTVVSNKSDQQPGVYLNHSVVQFAGYGEEINTGPDAKTAFADPIGSLPAGATTIPPVPAQTPAQAPAQIQAPRQAPVLVSVLSNLGGVQPSDSFMQPGGPGGSRGFAPPPPINVPPPVMDAPPPPVMDAPPPPTVDAPPPPVINMKYMHQGVAYSAAELIASGWTELAIKALPTITTDGTPF